MSFSNFDPNAQGITHSISPYALDQLTSPIGPAVFSLTPDALLTYCQTRLQSLDGDIKQYMDDQKAQLAKKDVLQKLETAIQDNNTVNKKGKELASKKQAIADAYAAAYADLTKMGMGNEASAVKDAFKKAFPNSKITDEHPSTKGCKLPTQTQSAFDDFTQPVQNLVDEIGKEAELNMIQLQSLMSQRQTAVQLTTNMMSKLDRGFDAITANFK